MLHDVHWPGRPKANLDHIAIGPGGVFVIDAKNWSGSVRVKDGCLRQNGYRRDRETAALVNGASAVAALLEPRHRLLVHPVLCLAGEGSGSEGARTSDGVLVVGREHLAAALVTGRGDTSGPLSGTDIGAITGYLRDQLTGPRSPVQVTSAAAAEIPAHGRGPRVRPADLKPLEQSQPSRSLPRRNARRRISPRLAVALIAVLLALVVLPVLGGTA